MSPILILQASLLCCPLLPVSTETLIPPDSNTMYLDLKRPPGLRELFQSSGQEQARVHDLEFSYKLEGAGLEYEVALKFEWRI